MEEMGSVICHTKESYTMAPEVQEFPKMCVVSLLYVCNAKCKGCPYTNSDLRSLYKDRLFMNEDTFKIIADQCGEHGAWIRITGGGEPMLHPKIIELLEYAKKAGAKVGIITNGSLVTEEKSKRLIEMQLDMIEFSVDAGDPNTYSMVRNGLNWKRLVENVRSMIDFRNKLNGKTKIIASAVNQIGVNIEAVANFWEPLVDKFQKRKFLTWGINDPAGSADTTAYLPPEKRIPCPIIFERMYIGTDGKVMFCIYDIRGTTNMGNIHEKSIREIWKSGDFVNARQKHLDRCGADIEMCKKCLDWQYRSWQYNYWKIVSDAENKRLERVVRD